MMVESFLPAMRELVARRLAAEGWSQGRIASAMGVTQASISLYLKSEGRSEALLEPLGVTEDQASLYASLLAEDLKKNPVYAVNTLYSLWSDALGRGALCAAHRSEHPSLAECTMCLLKFGPSLDAGEDAVEKVAASVKLLEGSSAFVRVMPEVSVNVAVAPEGASSVDEVVAVPGRIVKVRGMARSFMRPEYGASTHVASVLLAVLSSDASKRAAVNLRFDPKLEKLVRKEGLRVIRVEGGARLLESLKSSLKDSPGPDAVVDPGGQGTEPGLYLFAEGPVAVAELALRLARSYAVAR
jgi:predicted fused transcriptional regulator/phosphomethylpyrimidine kinase/predicted transcriptional regulator